MSKWPNTVVTVIMLTSLCSAGGCDTPRTDSSPQIFRVKQDDPICSDIAREILDDNHIPHDSNFVQRLAARQLACFRSISQYGHVTMVLRAESKPYRLTLVFGANGRAKKVTVDPANYQNEIGILAIHSRIDSVPQEVANILAAEDYFAVSCDVEPW